MRRCKICDKQYTPEWVSRFPKEDYCLVCETEILVCLLELEDPEETEEEEPE